jgi:hypothetical protein
MRNLRVLAVCALLLALVPALDLTAQRPRGSAAANHVVIIRLDGFGGWALDLEHDAPCPPGRGADQTGIGGTGEVGVPISQPPCRYHPADPQFLSCA